MGFYEGDDNDANTKAFNDKYIKDQKFATAPFWNLFPKLRDIDEYDNPLLPLPFNFNFRDLGDSALAMASGIPTVKQFDKCEELKGQSAWTTQGIWKCLVPSKTIPLYHNWTSSYLWRRSNLTSRTLMGCSSMILTSF